jgi:hypothetical protein
MLARCSDLRTTRDGAQDGIMANRYSYCRHWTVTPRPLPSPASGRVGLEIGFDLIEGGANTASNDGLLPIAPGFSEKIAPAVKLLSSDRMSWSIRLPAMRSSLVSLSGSSVVI